MSSSSSRNAFEDGKYKTNLLTLDSSSRCRKITPSSRASPSPPKQLLVATPVEEGEYPVVMLLHGYLLYNSFYSQLMLHVSSHGFILIAPQLYSIAGPDTMDEIKSTAEIMDWLSDGLNHFLPPQVTPNLSKFVLSGHSRGGKTAFAVALKKFGYSSDLKISTLIGIDPVDGTGKGKQTPPPVLTYEPNTFDLDKIPMLVIGSGLGETARNPLFPPCAPPGVNHREFFRECQGPAWHFVAKDYGHLDMLDDDTKGIRGKSSYCLCKNGEERRPMRGFVGGIVVSFLKAYLEGDDRELVKIKDGCTPKHEGGLGLRSLKEANNVSCLKLIWRIVSQGNSLWVKWIQTNLLKKASFWSLNNNTSMGSWIWKKLLKYREVAKGFCKVEVGNGELTSFWFDDWSPMNRLFDTAGDRGIIDMGISRQSSVAQAWTGRRRRRHRAGYLNLMEAALLSQRQTRTEKVDTVVWRGKNDIFQPKFSTKDTWNHIRTTSNTVSWSKGVWFPHNTPKYSFCMWLAAHDRLSTGDRMIRWNGGVTGICVFCQNCVETRDHLFFACSFTSGIWKTTAKGILQARFTTGWSQLIDHVSNNHRGEVESFLIRYALQTTVYMIWRERNGRRHGQDQHSELLITKWIDKQVRNRITTLRRMGDRRYDAAYQMWLATRS